MAPNPEGRSIIALDISSSRFQGARGGVGSKMVAGVDVGGSSTKSCIVDGTTTLASAVVPTTLGTPADLVGYITTATGVTTSIENDMTVAAFGADTQLSTTEPTLEDPAYIGRGTGVSAGVVLSRNVPVSQPPIYPIGHGL